MSVFEKFWAVFFMSLLLGCGYMIYESANHQANCIKAALSQNYSSDQVRKICR